MSELPLKMCCWQFNQIYVLAASRKTTVRTVQDVYCSLLITEMESVCSPKALSMKAWWVSHEVRRSLHFPIDSLIMAWLINSKTCPVEANWYEDIPKICSPEDWLAGKPLRSSRFLGVLQPLGSPWLCVYQVLARPPQGGITSSCPARWVNWGSHVHGELTTFRPVQSCRKHHWMFSRIPKWAYEFHI